ncbi:MAG TPA: 4,5-DOPA dioxygenase extradiol [Kofleriaceae bacterium]|nr:4,5-DOPA dioxygenase extradiol [Kofleriaceae bacterium]
MSAERMPTLFIGHGNPMNAIVPGPYGDAWTRLAGELPRPRSILAVSAHWFVPGTRVTAQERPRTLHDFGGFPRELSQVQYPAPGSPALARRVGELLGPTEVALDERWGLDHGTWSVLVHMFPSADVPVVQLSIDETLTAVEHGRLARGLRALRDEGVLVLGSGNVVHNLHAYAWGRHPVDPYDWGVRFEARMREHLIARDFAAVARYEELGSDATLSAPTPEHFLPLVYAVAPCDADEPVSFPVEGFDGGSISMLAVRIG